MNASENGPVMRVRAVTGEREIIDLCMAHGGPLDEEVDQ